MRTLALALVALAALLGGCDRALTSPDAAPTVSAVHGFTQDGPTTRVTAIGCRVLNGRADVRCTPGATNPAVAQATVHATICVKGWTATVRPPVSVTEPLKRQQLNLYSETGPLASYEEDHLLPLELGGAPRDPANLWPEPRTTGGVGAAAKDGDERRLNAAVCAGRTTLAAAQARILASWTH